jgi:hypothetical protein
MPQQLPLSAFPRPLRCESVNVNNVDPMFITADVTNGNVPEQELTVQVCYIHSIGVNDMYVTEPTQRKVFQDLRVNTN